MPGRHCAAQQQAKAFVGLMRAGKRMLECAPQAQVAKLVDAPDLGSGAERCGGSSPFLGTKERSSLDNPRLLYFSPRTLLTLIGFWFRGVDKYLRKPPLFQ